MSYERIHGDCSELDESDDALTVFANPSWPELLFGSLPELRGTEYFECEDEEVDEAEEARLQEALAAELCQEARLVLEVGYSALTDDQVAGKVDSDIHEGQKDLDSERKEEAPAMHTPSPVLPSTPLELTVPEELQSAIATITTPTTPTTT
eukprot:CAMPEP_0115104792 /NCGR_PEP_ID=MMETSP0227-20121206/35550_1 /TAXON_ID=89957 /ORGANISM="Polarella glacialis, Strain CCMP 1383" /LENGTH=150 /DNA_ID=CAMNT_0002501825 /DNA_START=1 /DNA_END=450 /DNA_ORIENTATION=+